MEYQITVTVTVGRQRPYKILQLNALKNVSITLMLLLLQGGSAAKRVRLRRRRARVQIAAATLSGNSLRQTVHTHCASVHQTA